MARSYYVERRYERCPAELREVGARYPQTKEGREASNFAASSLFANGPRRRSRGALCRVSRKISQWRTHRHGSSEYHRWLSRIRAPQDAIIWINRTRERFAGNVVETNAVFCAAQVGIFALADWPHAVQTADDCCKTLPTGSNTSFDEVLYLKAHALERGGRTQDAVRTYLMIPDNVNSYYGGLATSRLAAINDSTAHQRAAETLADSPGRPVRRCRRLSGALPFSDCW